MFLVLARSFLEISQLNIIHIPKEYGKILSICLLCQCDS